jgi:hypothetical protein
VTEDGDIIPVTLGILQPDGTIVPEAPPDAPADAAAEDAAPPPEPPPPRPPPLTRAPRPGDPPLTPEQRAEWQRRLASDPNYKPSAYWPL